jgi:hypothetical protein
MKKAVAVTLAALLLTASCASGQPSSGEPTPTPPGETVTPPKTPAPSPVQSPEPSLTPSPEPSPAPSVDINFGLNEWQQIYMDYFTDLEEPPYYIWTQYHLIDLNEDGIPEILLGGSWGIGRNWIYKCVWIADGKIASVTFEHQIDDLQKVLYRETEKIYWLSIYADHTKEFSWWLLERMDFIHSFSGEPEFLYYSEDEWSDDDYEGTYTARFTTTGDYNNMIETNVDELWRVYDAVIAPYDFLDYRVETAPYPYSGGIYGFDAVELAEFLRQW